MRGLVALAALVLAACSGDGLGQGDSSPPPRVGAAGVTVELPSGWHSTAPRDGNVIDPLTRVVVSSAPIDEWTEECQTQVVHYAPRGDAVTLIVLEWKPSPDARHPPRPERFTHASMPLFARALECWDGRGATAFFEDRERVFGAYLMLGKDAAPSLADDARSVLDSLRVIPKP
jgi:hypothetical protein